VHDLFQFILPCVVGVLQLIQTSNAVPVSSESQHNQCSVRMILEEIVFRRFS
jgi:hypothetical protein